MDDEAGNIIMIIIAIIATIIFPVIAPITIPACAFAARRLRKD